MHSFAPFSWNLVWLKRYLNLFVKNLLKFARFAEILLDVAKLLPKFLFGRLNFAGIPPDLSVVSKLTKIRQN